MAVNVGDIVFLDYGERPQCIHSRLVLAEVDASTFEYVILTPDFDIYCEILDASNPDLAGFHVCGPGGRMPPNIRMARIYGFAPMSARDYSGYMRAGRAEADAERGRRGVPPLPLAPALPNAPDGAADAGGPMPGLQAPPAPGAAGVQPAPDRVWVLCESCGDRKIGEQVVPPAGVPMLADYGLMQIDAEAGNGRVCLIKQVGLGKLAAFCEERVQYARAGEAM